MESNRQWTGKSYGGRFGHECFVFLLRHFGLYPAYCLLFFVSLYFMIFRRKAYRFSSDYLRRFDDVSKLAMPYHVFRHNFSLGLTLIDKAAYFSGSKKIQCKNHCRLQIEKMLGDGRGLIALTAHIGGREMASDILKEYGREVRIVGAETEDEKIKKAIDKIETGNKKNLISHGSFEMFLESYKTLKKGGIVAMQFDRDIGGGGCEVEFLGGKTIIPTRAFELAEKSDCGMIFILCIREKLFNYAIIQVGKIDLDDLSKGKAKEIAEKKLPAIMNSVEQVLSKYKYQWFNFYNYWNADE